MSKKILMITVLIIIVLGATGCSSGTDNWKEVEKDGISFKVPKAWESDEEGSVQNFYTGTFNTKEMHIRMSIRVFDKEDFPGEDLKKVKERETNKIFEPDDPVVTAEKIQVAGKEETKITITPDGVIMYPQNGEDAAKNEDASQMTYIYLASDEHLYFISFPVYDEMDTKVITQVIESINYN